MRLRRWPSAFTGSPAFAAAAGVRVSALACSRASARALDLRSNTWARAPPTAPRAMPLAVSRWSALSARRVRRNSARLVNIR